MGVKIIELVQASLSNLVTVQSLLQEYLQYLHKTLPSNVNLNLLKDNNYLYPELESYLAPTQEMSPQVCGPLGVNNKQAILLKDPGSDKDILGVCLLHTLSFYQNSNDIVIAEFYIRANLQRQGYGVKFLQLLAARYPDCFFEARVVNEHTDAVSFWQNAIPRLHPASLRVANGAKFGFPGVVFSYTI